MKQLTAATRDAGQRLGAHALHLEPERLGDEPPVVVVEEDVARAGLLRAAGAQHSVAPHGGAGRADPAQPLHADGRVDRVSRRMHLRDGGHHDLQARVEEGRVRPVAPELRRRRERELDAPQGLSSAPPERGEAEELAPVRDASLRSRW